jgi:hypothetical protein
LKYKYWFCSIKGICLRIEYLIFSFHQIILTRRNIFNRIYWNI